MINLCSCQKAETSLCDKKRKMLRKNGLGKASKPVAIEGIYIDNSGFSCHRNYGFKGAI